MNQQLGLCWIWTWQGLACCTGYELGKDWHVILDMDLARICCTGYELGKDWHVILDMDLARIGMLYWIWTWQGLACYTKMSHP
jgi:hypothetical protein